MTLFFRVDQKDMPLSMAKRGDVVKYLKRAVSLAAMVSAVPAWSQSSVTLYGLLDLGIDRVSGSSGNGVRMNNGTAASRFGFRGTEDIGGGMKAEFNLESGIPVDTGGPFSQGGRAFGRTSYVSLSGGFGTVGLGRQYVMRYYGIQDADLFGAGSQGLGLLDNGIPNARADNAITYRGNWGPVSAGANISLGRDTVNGSSVSATNCPGESTDSSKQCREWSFYTKYDGKNWGISTSYEKQYGGTSATFGGLTSPNLTDSRFSLSGYYNTVGDINLGAGWIRRDNMGIATPKSDLLWITAIIPVARQFYVDALLAELNYDASPNKATLANLRVRYVLSKRTFVYLSGAHVKNGGNLALSATSGSPTLLPVAGGSQTAIVTGIRHSF